MKGEWIVNNLALVKTEMFGDTKCDLYQNKQSEVFMTIGQLAKALGYTNRNGVTKIISRNEYLKQPEFSTNDRLSLVEGNRQVVRDLILFTEDGIYEVALKSDAPKAQEFRFWVRRVIKELRQEIQIQNKFREKGEEVPPTDLFQKLNARFEAQGESAVAAPVTNLDKAVSLFNTSYQSLYPETRDMAFQYLWKMLTGEDLKRAPLVPLAPWTPVPQVQATVVKPAVPKLQKSKDLIGDKALELVKAFIVKNKRTFEPRYGVHSSEFTYLRSDVLDFILSGATFTRRQAMDAFVNTGLIRVGVDHRGCRKLTWAITDRFNKNRVQSYYLGFKNEALI
jgi:prophage antirepressor-like protein